MPRNGDKKVRHDMHPSFGEPDRVAWERAARWELIGCIILMAAAVNLHAP
jgi:hypothetical protein